MRTSQPAAAGWAAFGTAGRLVGHFYIHNAYIHNADDSGFVCERA